MTRMSLVMSELVEVHPVRARTRANKIESVMTRSYEQVARQHKTS